MDRQLFAGPGELPAGRNGLQAYQDVVFALADDLEYVECPARVVLRQRRCIRKSDCGQGDRCDEPSHDVTLEVSAAERQLCCVLPQERIHGSTENSVLGLDDEAEARSQSPQTSSMHLNGEA